MPTGKQVAIVNDGELVPLRPKELLTLLAMIETNTDAEAIAKSPYAEAQFYRLKPKLEKYKQIYLEMQVEKSMGILRANAPRAASELVKQLDDRLTHNRNKAANDILDRALPKTKDTAGITINGDKVLVMPSDLIGKYGSTPSTETDSPKQ